MSGNGLRRLDTKSADFDVALESLLLRDDPFDSNVFQIAQDIIAGIRERGDSALCEYTARFDDFKVSKINVDQIVDFILNCRF